MEVFNIFFFHAEPSKSCVYFASRAGLVSGQSHLKCVRVAVKSGEGRRPEEVEVEIGREWP